MQSAHKNVERMCLAQCIQCIHVALHKVAAHVHRADERNDLGTRWCLVLVSGKAGETAECVKLWARRHVTDFAPKITLQHGWQTNWQASGWHVHGMKLSPCRCSRSAVYACGA